MMADTRSSPEASGFQSLFATASQDTADAGQNVASTVEHGTVSALIGRAGKKAAGSKAAGDSDKVLNALAAALAMPAAAAMACADSVPSSDNLAGITSPDPVAFSQAAASLTTTNLKGGAPPLSPETTSPETTTATAGAAGFLANLPGLSFAADVASPDEPIANVGDRNFAVAGSLPKQPARPTKTDDSLSPAAVESSPRAATRDVRVVSPAPRQNAIDSVDTGKGSGPGTPTMAEGNEIVTFVGASPPPNSQASGTITDASAAVIDTAARTTPVASFAAGEKTDSRKIAEASEGSTASAAEGAAAASASRPALAVDPPAADKFARERRERWFAGAEEGVSGGDGFSPTAQSSSSPQVLVQAVGQAVGTSTAHPNSPSAPIVSEHSSAPGTARPDATPAPPAPALQTTQVLQRMDKAEIRIGLQSAEFGAIRLHTAVANDQVGAAVSTSHPALHDALLSEAPSLEKAMARHNLRLDSVTSTPGRQIRTSTVSEATNVSHRRSGR